MIGRLRRWLVRGLRPDMPPPVGPPHRAREVEQRLAAAQAVQAEAQAAQAEATAVRARIASEIESVWYDRQRRERRARYWEWGAAHDEHERRQR